MSTPGVFAGDRHLPTTCDQAARPRFGLCLCNSTYTFPNIQHLTYTDMSHKPDRATAERNTRTLRELVKRPENKVCSDCKRNGACTPSLVACPTAEDPAMSIEADFCLTLQILDGLHGICMSIEYQECDRWKETNGFWMLGACSCAFGALEFIVEWARILARSSP